MLGLNVAGLVGLKNASVDRVRAGQPPVNITFPEQTLKLQASASDFNALTGNITMRFNSTPPETTAGLLPNATAAEMREALEALNAIGSVEVFREELSTDGVFGGYSWRVRFHHNSYPKHLGPQPKLELQYVPSGGSLRRLQASGLTLTSELTVEGSAPPTVLITPEVIDEYSDPSNDTSAAELTYVKPVHICGDGVRTTAEICDDNNTVGGDGCDTLCRVETGFECTSTSAFGSGVGGLDVCAPKCGDGVRVLWLTAEACDDNNTISGD